jgi:hypothetical protein
MWESGDSDTVGPRGARAWKGWMGEAGWGILFFFGHAREEVGVVLFSWGFCFGLHRACVRACVRMLDRRALGDDEEEEVGLQTFTFSAAGPPSLTPSVLVG